MEHNTVEKETSAEEIFILSGPHASYQLHAAVKLLIFKRKLSQRHTLPDCHATQGLILRGWDQKHMQIVF